MAEIKRDMEQGAGVESGCAQKGAMGKSLTGTAKPLSNVTEGVKNWPKAPTVSAGSGFRIKS